ncbi:MAG: hypothetical protein WCK96_12985 [Methylococcales bacterium]
MTHSLSVYLVPTRRVGIHSDRAADCYATRRVETVFPRGAWERQITPFQY